jgi:preprotein translocase subunit SecG
LLIIFYGFGAMLTFMSIVFIFMSVLLILAVLIQPGKGSGLASSGMGGMSGQFSTMFGARRTSDFLQKFTIGIALAILLFVLLTNKFFVTPNMQVETGERAPVTQGAAVPQLPAQAPATPTQQPTQQPVR